MLAECRGALADRAGCLGQLNWCGGYRRRLFHAGEFHVLKEIHRLNMWVFQGLLRAKNWAAGDPSLIESVKDFLGSLVHTPDLHPRTE